MGCSMRTFSYDKNIFKERRDQLKKLAPNSAFILPAAETLKLVAFRQESNFFYLSGFEEPNAIVVILTGPTNKFILFVQAKDPTKETWDGFRFGPQGAISEFGADEAYTMDQWDSKAPSLFKETEQVYFNIGDNEAFDRKILNTLKTTKQLTGRSGKGLIPIYDPNIILGEMRIIKSDYEHQCLQTAGDISSLAHIEAMKYTKPGINEREILGALLSVFYAHCGKREGYSSIIASGNNATTLHYIFNDQVCKKDDLLLIDAGCEKDFYTADITRTFPVSGKFSTAQKDFYQAVLDVQKKLIDEVSTQTSLRGLHNSSEKYLTEAMIQLKLLPNNLDEQLEKKTFRKYYPHSLGHYLGMDVHDIGTYEKNGKPRLLEKGMCFTIEPGIYVPENDTTAPKEFRGFGVRIEDDVTINSQGKTHVFTSGVPKEVNEIEAIMAQDIEARPLNAPLA